VSVGGESGELPFAFGGPALTGRLRARPEDFEVEEDLGFAPSGAGEHLMLWVEKRGANTEWVARQLARLAGIAPVGVGFAGLKDRHAVTRQWFSLHLPGREAPDFAATPIEGVRVLEAHRHARKLPRGALAGNRFRLVLREIAGDRDAAAAALDRIAAEGLPNGFGEQRFGREGGNLPRAKAMFAGRRVDRAERGILLSAARSALFNRVLAARIADGSWNRLRDGDVAQLDGTGSVFGPVTPDAELDSRCAALDLHPTGPLWGSGVLRSAGSVHALEAAVGAADAELSGGLVAAGLRQERRALRVRVDRLDHRFEGDALHLSFGLPAGAYATALVREVLAPATGHDERPEKRDETPDGGLAGDL
jgi:tRNA pseudouridine13 synthase